MGRAMRSIYQTKYDELPYRRHEEAYNNSPLFGQNSHAKTPAAENLAGNSFTRYPFIHQRVCKRKRHARRRRARPKTQQDCPRRATRLTPPHEAPITTRTPLLLEMSAKPAGSRPSSTVEHAKTKAPPASTKATSSCTLSSGENSRLLAAR